jgi:hypothetical protein
MNSFGFIALAGASVALASGRAGADDGRLLDDETFSYKPPYCAVWDGGFFLAAPTALPTGLASGIGAGVTVGKTFAWGVRASYASASEDGEAWAVTHREVRALATGTVQHELGRGLLGLRVGLGGTFIHEHRMRHQGMRAGLEGDELEATNLALLPTATLDATIGLHVRGAWMLQLSAGPSISIVDGDARGAWSTALGVAWHP